MTIFNGIRFRILEYEVLTEDFRDARRDLRKKKSEIEFVAEVYDLGDANASVNHHCITKFKRVKNPVTQHVDDAGITVFCDNFCCHKPCQNSICKYQEQNWNVVAAQIAYDDVRKERKAFITGLFRKHTK